MGFTITDGLLSKYADQPNVRIAKIPDDVFIIGDSAFSWCTSLKKVIIPDSVISIRDWAFSQCKGLESIVIPDSVETIGRGVFLDCSELKFLTLPDNIIEFGTIAINGCFRLTDIIIKGRKTTVRIHDERITNEKNIIKADAYKVFDFIKGNLRRKEQVFRRTESMVYLIPLAVFLAFEYDSRAGRDFICENVVETVKYLAAANDVQNVTNILPYINQTDLDSLISYTIATRKTELQLILMNQKNKSFGFQNELANLLL